MNKNTQKILFAIPIVVGIYLIVRQLTKRRPQNNISPVIDPVLGYNPIGGGGSSSSTRNDSFPLKKGSFGDNVKKLQTAITAIDANLLRRYGIDSDFGGETEAAVERLLGTKTVSEAQLADLQRRASAGPRPYVAPPADPNTPFFLTTIR